MADKISVCKIGFFSSICELEVTLQDLPSSLEPSAGDSTNTEYSTYFSHQPSCTAVYPVLKQAV